MTTEIIIIIGKPKLFVRCIEEAAKKKVPIYSFADVKAFKAWEMTDGQELRESIGILAIENKNHQRFPETDEERDLCVQIHDDPKIKASIILLDMERHQGCIDKYASVTRLNVTFVSGKDLLLEYKTALGYLCGRREK